MSTEDNIQSLRLEVREWLQTNVPDGWREAMTNVEQEQFVTLQKEWFVKLSQAGYATPHWPQGWHGGGRSLAEQKVIFEEVARADAPRLILFFVALYHAACTLFECGTEQQQEKYLHGILNGEIWCQGFSEPNAGSDLASLRTKAVRRGDHYIVNGQKTWSTMAQYADYCLLLTRTDNSGPPQAGLTYLLLDMKSKGVSVRPISQITGDDEFAEIFFDDVEVAIENRVGEEGAGWAVAQATLASERGLTLVELTQRMRYALPMLTKTMHDRGCREDPVLQRDLGKLIVNVDAACALADQYLMKRISDTEQVGDASIVKLVYAKTLREFAALGVRINGLEGQYHSGFMRGATQETGNWTLDFMNSYNWSIAGGSNEIQRNIISERMLGMPREPKSWQVTEGKS
ncbi:acyl-CoA dehydrogenase [Ketobacter sp. MCCC 1A13808]|mgnify:CR=1 FL=1|uniref:acyl-CoA dehydrogenase family protein n=1 Tax=Ketobacter sp. MCCC 1A13808 TaxID=2602738 RepID=UPI000F1A4E98|nr:acyl-CoA dehydrogenase family protein [Ketobacter sp. MCCC 1A13808]MVF13455.1 acyl-CoA dehydrogenase [Ketobacter sp. MCCC 1A13808]RLP52973.1 MAG: acyl-CoA dehydrogenase [Ketobacter sp.]